MELLIASTNRGKIREFREMLMTSGTFCFTDLREHGDYPVVEETGATFLANACLKAGEYARLSNVWALADDSGLAVDALEGKPGVFSARWASMHGAGEGIMRITRCWCGNWMKRVTKPAPPGSSVRWRWRNRTGRCFSRRAGASKGGF